MEMLQESIKVERAQREVLEDRVRASEEEWFVHDKMMSDIKQQLLEIRQVCHDAKESWKREVEKLCSTQQPQAQLLSFLQQYAEQQLPYIKQEPF